MDLVSYLRPLRRFLVVFVVLAIAVGAGTAYLMWRSTETTYRATLDLRLPTFTGQARELEQLAADYVDGMDAGSVVDAAAAASGLTAAELRGTLTADRSTEFGSGVRVEASGADPTQLSRAVAAAAEENFRRLAQPRLDAARALAERLQTEYAEVQVSTEGADPDQTRRQAQREFAALRAVTDARSDVLDLEILVGQVEDAASPDAVFVDQVDETWPIVQAGVTNGGATLFALIALLVAVEIWRTRPARRQAVALDHDQPTQSTTAAEVPVPATAVTDDGRAARGDTVRIGADERDPGQLAGSTKAPSS